MKKSMILMSVGLLLGQIELEGVMAKAPVAAKAPAKPISINGNNIYLNGNPFPGFSLTNTLPSSSSYGPFFINVKISSGKPLTFHVSEDTPNDSPISYNLISNYGNILNISLTSWNPPSGITVGASVKSPNLFSYTGRFGQKKSQTITIYA